MENTKWIIDPTHSEITFKVKHLMISTVRGSFKIFKGEVESSDDFKSVKNISFKAEVKSIDTNNEPRDNHLKSNDFFAMEKHPHIKFSANSFEANDEKVHGELTIRDTTKPIVLDVDFGGTVVDGYGQTKAGLTLTGKISRKEFGLIWNNVTEAGSVVVSDEVRLNADVQFIKQA